MITWLPYLIALLPLFVSVWTVVTAGRRRYAEFRQQWLHELQNKVSLLLAAANRRFEELNTESKPAPYDPTIAQNIEHLCLMLDERDEDLFSRLRGYIVRLGLVMEGNDLAKFSQATNDVINAARLVMKSEAQEIKSEFTKLNPMNRRNHHGR